MNSVPEPTVQDEESSSVIPLILSSGRRVLQLGLQSFHVRLELFSLELREESLRAFKALILVSAFILSAALALLMASFTLIFSVWDDPAERLRMLWTLSGCYLGAALLIGLCTWRFVHANRLPFAETLREFERDREWTEGDQKPKP